MGMKIPVDFSDVPERGSIRVPEGEYRLKGKKAEKTNSKSGNPMLVVTFEFVDGKYKGKTIKDRHVLVPQSLWTLRNMLEAMGWKIKPAKMKLDVDKMIIGRMVGASIIDGEEYQGRISSEIADYVPVDAIDDFVSEVEDVDEAMSVFESDDEDDEEDAFFEDEDEDDEEEEDEEAEEDEDEEDEDEDIEEVELDGDEEEDEDLEWEFDEDEDEEEEDIPSEEEIREMTGKQLKALAKEWDINLKGARKVKQVKDLIVEFFHEEDEEEDDDELEDFDLDDLE